MKKFYLDDYATVKLCYENNDNFQRYVENECHQHNMDVMDYDINDANFKGLKWNHHYSWFFYSITNRDEFVESVLKSDYSHFVIKSKEEQKRITGTYRVYKHLNDANETLNDETIFNYWDKEMEEIANELLDRWNAYLKMYEHPTSDDVECYLNNIACESFCDYYVIDENYNEIFEDVCKTVKQF